MLSYSKLINKHIQLSYRLAHDLRFVNTLTTIKLMKLPARLKYIILTFLLIGGTLNALATTRKIVKSSRRLNEAEEKVLGLKEEKEKLLEDIKYKRTSDYLEETARDKLNLIKPGEEIYIYPKDKKFHQENQNKRYENLQEKQKPIDTWIELIF